MTSSRTLDYLTLLDELARRNTVLGRCDSRVKVVIVLALLITLASFAPHDVTRPVPLVVFFAAALALGEIPAKVVASRLLFASPFALLVAVWNPLFDQGPGLEVGDVTLSAGWLSFASVLLRFAFAFGAVLVLVAVTGFDEVCRAARSLGAPRVFVTQLLLLYRFFFLVASEVSRMLVAHALRSGRRPTLATARPMLGALLLRSVSRAEQVHAAMLCRGFAGTVPSRSLPRLHWSDGALLVLSLGFFGLVRVFDLTHLAGSALLRLP